MTEEVETIIKILAVVIALASLMGIANVIDLSSKNKKLVSSHEFYDEIFILLFGKGISHIGAGVGKVICKYEDGSIKEFVVKEVHSYEKSG